MVESIVSTGLAIGCICAAVMMFGHGVMTPFVHGRSMNMWIGRFPFLAIAGTALGFGLFAAVYHLALMVLVRD